VLTVVAPDDAKLAVVQPPQKLGTSSLRVLAEPRIQLVGERGDLIHAGQPERLLRLALAPPGLLFDDA
jgi:hypothetical protein